MTLAANLAALASRLVGTAANNLVALDGDAKLPAVDGSQLLGLGAVTPKATQLFTVSGNYTPTPGTKFIMVVAKGGSGGGNNGRTGAPGPTAISFAGVDDTQSYPVVIGAGGGGTSGQTAGDGGASHVTIQGIQYGAPGGAGAKYNNGQYWPGRPLTPLPAAILTLTLQREEREGGNVQLSGGYPWYLLQCGGGGKSKWQPRRSRNSGVWSMKTAHILDASGLVINSIVVASEEDATQFGATLGPDGVGIGWRYVGQEWVAPPEPELVPKLIDLTPRQLRLGLLNIGIKPADVSAAIEQLPSPDREKAEIEWEYANTFQRDHPLIGILANHFGLSKEAVDKAWLASMAL